MGKVINKRVGRSFKNFLRGVGYPRFQGRNRYDYFTYPQMGFALSTDEQVEPLKHYRKVEDKLRVAGKNLSRKVVSLVAAHNTTQPCSGCGEMVKKSLAIRIHKCPICGLILDRDHNAAIIILSKVGQDMPELSPVDMFVGMSVKQDVSDL